MVGAKRRDGHRCRWPHQSDAERARCRLFTATAAHLTHRGMGGDPKLLRTRRELLITLGWSCHRDTVDSLDAKDRRVVFLSDRKADAPCAFEKRVGRTWVLVHEEKFIGDGNR